MTATVTSTKEDPTAAAVVEAVVEVVTVVGEEAIQTEAVRRLMLGSTIAVTVATGAVAASSSPLVMATGGDDDAM